MICKECGAYNPDHASFCKVCAASLKDANVYDEEPEASIPEEPLQEDAGTHPARTFAKPPVWKPVSNFSFEPRQRTSSTYLDEDAAEEDPTEGKESFRAPVASGRFRDDEPIDDEPAADEDEQEEPVRKAPAKPVKRSYAVEEDDGDDQDEEEVFVRRKPVHHPAVEVDAYEQEEDDEDEAPIVRKKPAANPVAKKPAKPVLRYEDEEEDDDEDEDDFRPAKKAVKKTAKPVLRYDDEDEDDEDEDDDDFRPAKKAAKKPAKPVRRYDDDDDDEEDEDDEDDDTPRRGRSPGSGIFTILLIVLLVLILGVAAAFVIANSNMAIAANMPGFMKIAACSGTEPVSTDPAVPVDNTQPVDGEQPVVAVDPTAQTAYIEDCTSEDGTPCVKFCVRVDVGETLTIDLPNQDDYTITNTGESAVDYKIEVPKQAFNPNVPLDTAEYSVTPNVTLTDASGAVTAVALDPFTINFPTISLQLTTPAVTGEPVMAAEGNVITLEGKVDTHTVTVTANGQPMSVYADGYFKGDYTMQGDADEAVIITATQDNMVSASTEIAVTPYVFVAQEMTVAITKGVAALRAGNGGTVTIKGVAEPGATLTATSGNEKVACGSASVDASGNFVIVATFNEDYYGIATITVNAVKEGYVEAVDSCVVTRMYDDRAQMTKNKLYKEVPAHISGEDLVANPTQDGYFRVTIRLEEVMQVDGYTICKVSILQSGKDNITAYVMNQSTKWDPTENRVGNRYNVYTMLNGLYPDTENLYMVAFFAVAKD